MADTKLILRIDNLAHKLISAESEIAFGETFDIIFEGLEDYSGKTAGVYLDDISGTQSLWGIDAAIQTVDGKACIQNCVINTEEALEVLTFSEVETRISLYLKSASYSTYYGDTKLRLHPGKTESGETYTELVPSIEQHNEDPTAHADIRQAVETIGTQTIAEVNTIIANHGASEEAARNQAIANAMTTVEADILSQVDTNLATQVQAAQAAADEAEGYAQSALSHKSAAEGSATEAAGSATSAASSAESAQNCLNAVTDIAATVASQADVCATAQADVLAKTINVQENATQVASNATAVAQAKSVVLASATNVEQIASGFTADVESIIAQVETAGNNAVTEINQERASAVELVTGAKTDAIEAIQVELEKIQNIEDIVEGFDETVQQGVNDINTARNSGITDINTAKTSAVGEVDAAKTAGVQAVADAAVGAKAELDGVVADAETALQGKVDAAEESIAQSTETATTAATDAAKAQEGAEEAETGAETAKEAASNSATAASASATQAATSATEAAEAAAEIDQKAASIGLLLVKPGCPINIEERNGAICQVRCMGENRFMPACDGVYYSVTSSTKTYFLDKSLNIVKVFNKTFGKFSYHSYAACGSGTFIVRDGLIWYTDNNSLNVADWGTGNILASLSGYNSVVHNGLSGHMVAITNNGLTAAIVTYDAENNAIVVSATHDTGLPFTASSSCRVHPYHMEKFTLVHLEQGYNTLGTKIYALNSADVFEEVSADVDGDPILFNCTATAAGYSGDEYTNQYASKNPGFYWTGSTFTDSEGASQQAFTLTNGLRIWVTSGTTTEGVPVFAKFNTAYGNKQGLVFGYPWQGASPNNRIPVAISCGCKSNNGYFYGCVLSGNVTTNNLYTPYILKPSIPFAQTSAGGYNSGASLQETKASNIVAIRPVAPLRGVFSFGGNWDYNATTPGMLIDLRQPLV